MIFFSVFRDHRYLNQSDTIHALEGVAHLLLQAALESHNIDIF